MSTRSSTHSARPVLAQRSAHSSAMRRARRGTTGYSRGPYTGPCRASPTGEADGFPPAAAAAGRARVGHRTGERTQSKEYRSGSVGPDPAGVLKWYSQGVLAGVLGAAGRRRLLRRGGRPTLSALTIFHIRCGCGSGPVPVKMHAAPSCPWRSCGPGQSPPAVDAFPAQLLRESTGVCCPSEEADRGEPSQSWLCEQRRVQSRHACGTRARR